MYRTLKAPLNVQIELTWECPNRCRHCYNSFRHDDTPIIAMSDDQLDRVISELVKNKIVRTVITGGEPLLVPEMTVRAVKELRFRNIGVSMNSTLMDLTPELAQQLKDAGLITIMTSLISADPAIHDFVTQAPGSWEKTVAGIRLAVSYGFRVSVNMVLTKWNFHTIRETGDLVGEIGAYGFGATRACAPTPIATEFIENLISVAEVRESLKIMYELKEKWGYQVDVFEHYPWCALQDLGKYKHLARRKCTAGITSCSIGADGSLRPCGHNAHKYGNIFTLGLEESWALMTDWREGKHIQASCQKCKYVRECTGGCPVEAEMSQKGRDHHSTGPGDITVPFSYPKVNMNPVSGKFVFAEETLFRKEEFGGILGSCRGDISLVDETTMKVVESLAELPSFGMETLTEMGVSETNATIFLNRLSDQKLIRKEE